MNGESDAVRIFTAFKASVTFQQAQLRGGQEQFKDSNPEASINFGTRADALLDVLTALNFALQGPKEQQAEVTLDTAPFLTANLRRLYARARQLGTVEGITLSWFVHSEWLELTFDNEVTMFEHIVGSNAPATRITDLRALELLELTNGEE